MNKRTRQLMAEAEAQAAKPFVPPRFSFGPSLLDIACGQCGEQSDAELWTKDGLGQDRPVNEFQCPRCRHAFVIVINPDIHRPNTLKTIPPTL